MAADSDPVAALHPRIRAFYTVWLRKRGIRRAPARRDFDPVEMRDFLPNLYMFDVVEPGARLRYRLIGTAVAELAGEVTGKFIDEVLPPAMYAALRPHYDDVVRHFIPRYHANDLGWQGRPYIRYYRLLLPLSDDQRSVNMALGIHYHERARGGAIVPIGQLQPLAASVDIRLQPDEPG